jgi:hypothetical protein
VTTIHHISERERERERERRESTEHVDEDRQTVHGTHSDTEKQALNDTSKRAMSATRAKLPCVSFTAVYNEKVANTAMDRANTT